MKLARDRLARVQNRHRRAAEKAVENAGARDPRVNITDPDSGPMPVAGGGFIQGYNAQLAVADDQIIIAATAVTDTVDTPHYLAMAAAAQDGARALNRGRHHSPNEAIKTKQDTIGTIVADAGYLSIENLTTAGPDRLIATRRRHKLEVAAKNANNTAAADEHDDTAELDDPIKQMSRRLTSPDAMANLPTSRRDRRTRQRPPQRPHRPTPLLPTRPNRRPSRTRPRRDHREPPQNLETPSPDHEDRIARHPKGQQPPVASPMPPGDHPAPTVRQPRQPHDVTDETKGLSVERCKWRFHYRSSAAGIRSAKVIAKAFSAGFQRVAHRV